MRPASGEDGWLSPARGDLCGGCHTYWRGRWKSQNRKIVPLSPYVEEPLNSKVIKSFVPEQRSRYVSFEFRDSYVIYVMNSLCTFRVAVFGYGTHIHICIPMVNSQPYVNIYTHRYIPVATLAYFCYSCPPALCQLQFPTRGPWTQSKSS